ncbi:MAG: Hpt domain-containing protein [Arthrobacter sp.]
MPESVPGRLELSSIEALAAELDSHALALNFLCDYLAMLPGRMARITNHLGEQDGDAAMDALLSLRVTSSMAGALDAEAACRNLETLVSRSRFEEAANAALQLNQQVLSLVAAAPAIVIAARFEHLPLAS